MNEDRLKIAVFIDFDNIEIGVKSTLNRHFDIGAVLEAIKEKGEVVTKIAYGDWKRAGEHSRSMTQHAIQMVQRNLTPGGDKNGADINLALDALEMAFTRNHINAFVIVGGDSDFIALVEKLKQYDKKVLVVGGRAFTSAILQKNCHEFIAYENLIAPAPQAAPRRLPEKARSVADGNLTKAFPLIRRALKVLTDREVSPQLGLLKSTLLQLDSTFTERDYGANTFRDFIEKMAGAGFVKLKQVDRSLLVELKDGEALKESEALKDSEPMRDAEAPGEDQDSVAVAAVPVAPPSPGLMDEGIRVMQEVFQNPKIIPHWPMYLRNVKQYIKNAAPSFDERRYGFASFLEAIRSAQRSGVFRLERNRQGILRVYPGSQIAQAPRLDFPANEGTSAEEQASSTSFPMDESMSAAEVQAETGAVAVEAAGMEQGIDLPSEEPRAESKLEGDAEPQPARRKRAAAGTGTRRKPGIPRVAKTATKKRTRKKPAPTEEEPTP